MDEDTVTAPRALGFFRYAHTRPLHAWFVPKILTNYITIATQRRSHSSHHVPTARAILKDAGVIGSI